MRFQAQAALSFVGSLRRPDRGALTSPLDHVAPRGAQCRRDAHVVLPAGRLTLTSSSLPPRTAARRCDLRNLRILLDVPEHAREQGLRRRSGGYVTHRSTGDPQIRPGQRSRNRPLMLWVMPTSSPAAEVLVSRRTGMPMKFSRGNSGCFDFVSGRVPRAPAPLSDHGLEWISRLAIEPQRRWRRYLWWGPRVPEPGDGASPPAPPGESLRLHQPG